jgi:AraC-like DNA-binding protein
MSAVWRARDVPAAIRLDYMRHAVADTIVPFDLHVAGALDTRGGIRSADVGMARVVHLTAPAGVDFEIVRDSRLIRRSDPGLCKIDLQLRGRTVFEQDDRQFDLGPGDFAFADLSRPCRIGGSPCNAVVMFPRAWLPLWDRETRDLAGTRFRGGEPGAALVSSLVRRMVRDIDAYDGANGARFGAALLDLITATLASRVDRETALPIETRERALLVRIRAFIEERLGDPDLSPPMIAAAHHISLRQLYRLFEGQGEPVASLIRNRRLRHSRQDLLDPALRDMPVSAIARRWGFSSPALFNRAFRAEYDVPPGEYRRLRAFPRV